MIDSLTLALMIKCSFKYKVSYNSKKNKRMAKIDQF